MRTRLTYGFFLAGFILMILLSSITRAQKGNDIIRNEDGFVIIKFDKRLGEECEKLLKYFGLSADSLWNYKSIGQLTKDGWKLRHIDKNVAEIERPAETANKNIKWGKQPIYVEEHKAIPGTPGYPGPVAYGVNSFKSQVSVYENKKGETVFILHGYPKASKVYLSGNFNDWSTSSSPMQKTDSGWIRPVKLKPGKYFYKFIVDGNWMYDPSNNKKEPDGYDSYNSTYYRYNYDFDLPGYPSAKKVYVSGSFNDWNETELLMHHSADGWKLSLYLKEGSYSYKYIVDKQWILDPANNLARPDGQGNVNSFLSFGDTTLFRLNGYKEAKVVVLTGTFNDWNPAELQMSRTSSGWQIPYVLAPGNYEYKFIVDGRWIADASNPLTVGGADHRNSIKVVKPNYAFVLKRYTDAKEVLLSGSFNNWAEPGYTMIRKDGEWSFPIFLPEGKYTYKFIVDGKWIIDPDNSLIEENEYGTGNSVLWIEPEKQYLER